MTEVSTIGFDLAKRVFQAHGVDGEGAVTIRRQLRRSELMTFFAKPSPCMVGMEGVRLGPLLGADAGQTRA
jgi:transposase